MPFVLNQLGSVLFCYALSLSRVSLVVPIVNAGTFLITAVVSSALGERGLSPMSCVGIVLIATGSALMLIESD